jgi:hypothetical protein
MRALLAQEKGAIPSSASLRLTDQSWLDLLGFRYESVEFGVRTSLRSLNWCAAIDRERAGNRSNAHPIASTQGVYHAETGVIRV